MKQVGKSIKGVSIWFNGYDYDVVIENTNSLNDKKDGTWRRLAVRGTLKQAEQFRTEFIKEGFIYA